MVGSNGGPVWLGSWMPRRQGLTTHGLSKEGICVTCYFCAHVLLRAVGCPCTVPKLELGENEQNAISAIFLVHVLQIPRMHQGAH